MLACLSHCQTCISAQEAEGWPIYEYPSHTCDDKEIVNDFITDELPEKQIEHFTACLAGKEKLDENDFRFLVQIAVAYTGLGKYQSAIKYFTKAISVRPDDTDGYYERGKVYLKIENYDEETKDSLRAIMHDPENYLSYHQLSEIYRLTDNGPNHVRTNERTRELFY